MPSPSLADIVVHRRTELELSLRDLERLSGIPRGRLSQVERGQRGLGDDSLRQLAFALNLPLTELRIAAGLIELPPLQPYLRAAYGLDADGAADVARYLEQRYGAAGLPDDGEDEVPEEQLDERR